MANPLICLKNTKCKILGKEKVTLISLRYLQDDHAFAQVLYWDWCSKSSTYPVFDVVCCMSCLLWLFYCQLELDSRHV